MSPYLEDGDILSVFETNDNFGPGDLLLYKNSLDSELIVHRCLYAGICPTVKGDRNLEMDDFSVDLLIGRVSSVFRKGRNVSYINNIFCNRFLSLCSTNSCSEHGKVCRYLHQATLMVVIFLRKTILSIVYRISVMQR